MNNTLRRLARTPGRVASQLLKTIPAFRFVDETRDTQTPATLEAWLTQNVLGINRGPYWPVHRNSLVSNWRNICIGVETSPGLMPGCYVQGVGKIFVGDYTQIAPNVGIISGNHDLYDNRKHVESTVQIGKYCWLGMGAVVLPGVTLGDYTVVGANATVTKSFPVGYCVIAGNPARVIKTLDKERCVLHRSTHEYNGFVPAAQFPEFRAKHLNL